MLRILPALLFAFSVSVGATAIAQNADYDPQSGSETGPYQPPHTGFFKGKFWTDFRYRYEFVDQGNLPKDARASTLKNKTGVESGFFHGFRAGIEGEFVVNVGPEDFNNTPQRDLRAAQICQLPRR